MRKFFRLFSLVLVSSYLAVCGTLGVTATAVPSGSLYDYSYTFSVTGAGGGFDNIFLGSDDISPLNVQLTLNGAPTSDWSYLGNDTPQTYLQFFSQSATMLAVGSDLGVTFASALNPVDDHFAIALNSITATVSNQVNGVLAPTAGSSIPEPASLTFVLLAGSLGLGAVFLTTRRFTR